jgi:dTDP-4-dehydrorhamnose reductase
MKVLILGGSGMLGSMVTDVLSRDRHLEVVATVRNEETARLMQPVIPQARWRIFDAQDLRNMMGTDDLIQPLSWIVNAIGMTKPMIREDVSCDVLRAINVNSMFPTVLALSANKKKARVIQIATDCVFSGRDGPYYEDSPHDALDVYGKTKSLGEVNAANIHRLRCSIVGPELRGHRYLLNWFRGQAHNAHVNGYINHYWNGITTLAFAKICHGIIREDIPLPLIQHVLPQNQISKRDLLNLFGVYFRREDIEIGRKLTDNVVNRVLTTRNGELNVQLWKSAGYKFVPMISELIAELATFDFCCCKSNR